MSFYTDKEFFDQKRPWSRIKDTVLGSYLSAYLPKVNKLRNRIILIDGFAGPGKFDDEKAGSPLIICELADRFVKDNYLAIFVNNNLEHHNKLHALLANQIAGKRALTIYGNSCELLRELNAVLRDETLLIYLDPFGLKGLEFKSLIPYLERPKQYSTEIILNLSVPILHRLANKNAEKEGKENDSIVIACRENLNAVLGGDYWKKILLDENLSPNEQVGKVMLEYKNHLQKYLRVVGYCPVYECSTSSTLKYYIFFASRIIDAAVLMNDIMLRAFQSHIWSSTMGGTLFDSLENNEKKEMQLPSDYYSSLEELILSNLISSSYSRIDLWKKIVSEKFMRYYAPDFRKAITKLEKEGKILYRDIKGTGRINDLSIFTIRK